MGGPRVSPPQLIESEVARAEERSERARGRLTDTLLTLRHRLMPKVLARNLVDAISEKSADAAKAGADAVKARPGVVAGVTALAALFLARKPISRAISRDGDETPVPPRRSPAKPSRKGKS